MDISEACNDFPTIRKGKGVYLDSACQSLRPDQVIKAMVEYYEDFPSCGGRSVHGMSSKVSLMIDETREKLAAFFGTDDPDCYIFTKNCTEGINTVARGLSFSKNDVVVTTDTEHNSNHVPWLVLSDAVGIKRRFSVSHDDGSFDIENFKECMSKDVKLVSVLHASNVTGCVVPVKEVTEIAHDAGAEILVDGSQAAPHMKIDLNDLDVDYYSISIHKMLGPSGMGVLYGKRECLEKMRPLCVGGGTIGLATYEKAESAPIPEKFEAGLQNYSGIAGTMAAIDYLDRLGMEKISANDDMLMRTIFGETEDIRGLTVVGPEDPDKRCGIFSFNINGMASHDIAMMLDKIDNIMIRSGMHCAHPFFGAKGIEGSARASVYLYNSKEDIKRFSLALRKIADTFGH
jgi:Selenocysteine lyase